VLALLDWFQATEVADKLLGQYGPALGGAFFALVVLAGVITLLYRKVDQIYALRLREQEAQYEARLAENRKNCDDRLEEYRQLIGYQQVLLSRGIEIQDTTIKELGPRSRQR
jgi:hypothetical protein